MEYIVTPAINPVVGHYNSLVSVLQLITEHIFLTHYHYIYIYCTAAVWNI